ncbi:hypothetical protein GCM10022224_103120 [Nonomuraea antimicrobica]|uniref:Acyl-CoA dehydrogenase/oxidase C-terminal domain-containing protein n=1 Tax=Nonomuraea antimicrobica TaxID=561173 RepID=A0ABP7EN14_9ACTN
MIRALAAADASVALVLTMHYIHGNWAVAGPAPSRPIRELAAGGLVNLAGSEGVSGSPGRGGAVRTRAVPQPDGSWLITGHKRYVTGSVFLDHLLISATVQDGTAEIGAGRSGSSGSGDAESGGTTDKPVVRTFLVPADAPGLRIDPTWNAFGLRGSASHDVLLDEVRVPGDAVVEAYDAGLPEGRRFGIWWALLLASIHLGIAEAAREVALDFAAGPRTDGQPGTRAEQPRTQEHAARLELALTQARVLLEDALRRGATVADRTEAVAAAATKLLVHRHASDAVDHACRLVGGASVWHESPLGRHFRDLRVALFNPPNEDVVIDLVARSVLGLDEKRR